MKFQALFQSQLYCVCLCFKVPPTVSVLTTAECRQATGGLKSTFLSKMDLSPPVAFAAVHSESSVVVDSLFIVATIVCGFLCLVLVL